MKRISLSLPQFMFVVGTRAALAAGVALLVSRRLRDAQKKFAATALVGVGALTTVPAALLVLKRRSFLQRLRLAAG